MKKTPITIRLCSTLNVTLFLLILIGLQENAKVEAFFRCFLRKISNTQTSRLFNPGSKFSFRQPFCSGNGGDRPPNRKLECLDDAGESKRDDFRGWAIAVSAFRFDHGGRKKTTLKGFNERSYSGGTRGRSSLPSLPPATAALLISTIACYFFQLTNPYITQAGAKFAPYIFRGQYYRLFTPLFLHSGVVHLLNNMISLWNIGPAVENSFGPLVFATTYVFSGVLGNLVSCYTLKRSFGIGASGAVFGLVGALAFHVFRNRRVLGPGAERTLDSLKRTLFINVVYGISNNQIDHSAHLGGLVGGAIFAFLAGPVYEYGMTSKGVQLYNTNPVYTALRYPRFTFKGIAVYLLTKIGVYRKKNYR